MARKENMKVYHGIPKSIADEHTIFYLTDDSPILRNTTKKYNSPVGVGYTNFKGTDSYVASINSLSQLTVDFWIDTTNYKEDENSTILSVLSKNHDRIVLIDQPKLNKGRLFFEGTNKANQYGNYSVATNSLTGLNHIRCTINDPKMSIYVNGNLVSSANVFVNWNSNEKDIMLFTASLNNNTLTSVYNLKGSVISDLHISNIDRGDYFPNLPQDFIDGKAVIKPRMGQQQIKGDPMYSQVTSLKVPCTTTQQDKWIGDKNWTLIAGTSTARLSNVPEVTTTNSNFHHSGSNFSIKGLNGEVISGVIDTDTALCSVLSYGDGKLTSSETTTKKILKVSAVNGLVVNDTIILNNTLTPGGTSALTATIESIDSKNNMITLQEDINSSNIASYYIFETTPSSSSPIVKTQDGTTVVGTWSGLGTNVASLILGENADIAGKDLYVTYALTMPLGNSDFPELPHTIERAYGENGVEMKPVNQLVITDDFKGKIAGRIKECANIIKSASSPQLQQPSSFTFEHSTAGYKSVSVINDTDNLVKSADANTHIPQQLFSFNLIEMVERKLGCEIPSANKVQWLKDNITSYSCTAYGKGTHPSGNKYVLNHYCHAENRWYGDPRTHTLSTITSVEYLQSQSIWIVKSIDDNGFVHFIVYTDSSDGVTTSIVYTDYLELKLTLKTDSTFTTLYCENTRAREDKCNPVLIQKETKTVKRYLPSKECFATECKYVDMPRSVLTISELFKYHHKGTKVYSTTRGSGMYSKYTGIYPNIINLLKIADYNAHTYLNDGLKDSPVTSTTAMAFTEQLGESYAGNTLSGMPTEWYDLPKYIQIVPYTRLNNGELELMLYTSEIANNTDRVILYPKKMTKEYALSYKLPNRPLIK